MRTIAVVTVGRSDYSIYLPILRQMQRESSINLNIIVAGMHMLAQGGPTWLEIEKDGFTVDERLDFLLASDSPHGIATSIGLGTISYAGLFQRRRPDMLLLLGDRFDMYAAAVAALPFNIPIAHIHGGEVTEGAFDDALRHSLTKLSHLHFVSTDTYARRVAQLGEEEWRIVISGAPSLDNLIDFHPLSAGDLETRFGLSLSPPPLLVTFHPTSLEFEQAEWQAAELLAAVSSSELPAVFTGTNADTFGHKIRALIDTAAASHPHWRQVEHFGMCAYFSVLKHAAAMVGNSSSGIIEASSFSLPVVNVGSRQQGRVRPRNVIDTAYDRSSILEGIRRATSESFRAQTGDLVNPYDQGGAASRIVETLKSVQLAPRLVKKRFIDLDLPVAKTKVSAL